eukprot:TRINITY_DN601_c0_g1_i1.p1 TRINITY_DN601_c0_g1~~TRINITY_DN601_c0_g1_i1.p1  ORF type:complete len:159 (+),score=12.50 TRINITY_DN601_c0_g1_i1:45-521(+)
MGAAALLKLTVSDSIAAWTEITSTIPQGCSIRIPGQDNRLHFEPSSGGVGSGRGDLKPICKKTETNQLNQALQKENARLRDAIEAAVGVAGSAQAPAYRAGKASKENVSAETYNIVDGASHMILYTLAGIGVLFSIYSICTLCEHKNRFYTEVHDLEV